MTRLFIALEGLSACGKTTVGRLLADRLGATFYKTPSSLFEPMRAVVDEKADLTARFFFYMAGLAQSSLEISRLCETKTVVCDRYIDTTVCYHKAMGVPTDRLVTSPECALKLPDFTFLITCEQEKRLARLRIRGLSYNDMIEQQSGVEERFLEEYRRKKLIEVDNSCDDPAETAAKVQELLRRK